ncbi:unnamed protein product [Polarella glacialis]|uniref:50S ribosomal protein L12, chloroplastic n=1 Tax=Polarella glacialis TaxID=89957 RepID=A0A813EKB7_POLGL|nr:unnamed protein product [Polarella glacialis]|eukprot:CAMPEP_0115115656 /NCGR_PEP_ID=MMETSP0227-20121206/42829_1 /TAXON_ID=89957 /ORGANISM="Polarella glacialis, Strain CCMP 1383" /LENGTH=189 /DNA_ID=CAMNT_0002516383 /DNA_START=98 /DNA_END=667 /DNA_ORIENTATION=-
MPRFARPRHGAAGLMLALVAAVFGAMTCFPSSGASSGGPAAFTGVSNSRGAAPRSPAVARESAKVDTLVASLKELTLLEASELVKAIEETFGVDASSGGGGMMMMAPAAAAEAEEAAPEKSEFDVVLKEVPKDKKIAILKVVRTLTGMGLKEAKEMVDNPGKVMEKKPKDFCEDAKKQLEAAGAVVGLE